MYHIKNNKNLILQNEIKAIPEDFPLDKKLEYITFLLNKLDDNFKTQCFSQKSIIVPLTQNTTKEFYYLSLAHKKSTNGGHDLWIDIINLSKLNLLEQDKWNQGLPEDKLRDVHHFSTINELGKLKLNDDLLIRVLNKLQTLWNLSDETIDSLRINTHMIYTNGFSQVFENWNK